MPGMNRRGPEGEGPMSGRGRGRCNPANRVANSFEALSGAGTRASFRPDAGRGATRATGRGFGQGRSKRKRRREVERGKKKRKKRKREKKRKKIKKKNKKKKKKNK